MVQIFQISPGIAARHEALFLRLTALGKQVGAIALRRPEAAVSKSVRALAEAVLFDARPFVAARPRRQLPVAAPDYGGLAAQLGETLARLQAYEAQRTEWSASLECRVWRVAGEPLPVMRLMPRAAAPRPKGNDGQSDLARRLEQKITRLYDQGFADGLTAIFEKQQVEAPPPAPPPEPPPLAPVPPAGEPLRILGVPYPRAITFD